MTRSLLRNLAVLSAILLACGSAASWLWRYPTFRLFFAWPSGGTWSNTIAWIEDAAAGTIVVWFFRDRIGPRLAGWWKKHDGIHQHVTAEITGIEERLKAHLEERLGMHHEEIATMIQENGGK